MTSRSEALACERCGSVYPLFEGIPSFASQRDFYYGEVDRPEAHRLLRQIALQGYAEGVRAFLGSLPVAKADELRYYLLDPRRAAWRFLLDTSTGAHALDLGCGWGTLSFGLAAAFSMVTAMDLTMERLRFAQARAREEGRRNLRLVCGGDALHLPFPAASFDLVVLNGVLEWVPTGKPGEPSALQRAFLAEVARVLAPGGQVYLAIENRLSYRYLLGYPEDHTGLRFGALLPRPLANLYSLVRRRKPYRTYTYTERGYRRMLHESGFARVACHLPLPDYREIETIRIGAEGGDPRLLREPAAPGRPGVGVRQALKRTLERRFPPAFSFVASRGTTSTPTHLDAICEQAAAWVASHSGGVRPTWRIETPLRIGSAGAASFEFSVGDGDLRLTAKLPLDPLGTKALEANASTLAALDADARLSARCRRVLPRFLLRTGGAAPTAFIETSRPGLAGLAWITRGPAVAPLTERAFRILAALHRDTSRVVRLGDSHVLAWLAPFERRLRESREGEAALRRWEEIRRRLLADLDQAELPLVRSHGDFWIGNLLASEAGDEVSGLIDWAASEERSLPLLDAVHFILCLEKAKTGMRRPMAEIIQEKLHRGRISPLESDLLAGYRRHLGLSAGAMELLRPFVWIDHCLRYWDRLAIDGHWFHANVGRFLAGMEGGRHGAR